MYKHQSRLKLSLYRQQLQELAADVLGNGAESQTANRDHAAGFSCKARPAGGPHRAP